MIVLLCVANFCVEGGFANLAPYTVESYGVNLGARSSGLGQTANGFGKIIGPLSLSLIAGTSNLVTPQQTAAAVSRPFCSLPAAWSRSGCHFCCSAWRRTARQLRSTPTGHVKAFRTAPIAGWEHFFP